MAARHEAIGIKQVIRLEWMQKTANQIFCRLEWMQKRSGVNSTSS